MSNKQLISIDTIDSVNASIAKSIAIINLLLTNGQDLNKGFESCHSVILDALWDVSDQLDNIKNKLESK